ncbi:hypothetical protein ACVWW6_000386 [Bradyrhizobium sp. USDA 3311]
MLDCSIVPGPVVIERLDELGGSMPAAFVRPLAAAQGVDRLVGAMRRIHTFLHESGIVAPSPNQRLRSFRLDRVIPGAGFLEAFVGVDDGQVAALDALGKFDELGVGIDEPFNFGARLPKRGDRVLNLLRKAGQYESGNSRIQRDTKRS